MKVHLSVKTVAWVSSPADVGFLFPPSTALGRLSFIKMGTGQFSRNFLRRKEGVKKNWLSHLIIWPRAVMLGLQVHFWGSSFELPPS